VTWRNPGLGGVLLIGKLEITESWREGLKGGKGEEILGSIGFTGMSHQGSVSLHKVVRNKESRGQDGTLKGAAWGGLVQVPKCIARGRRVDLRIFKKRTVGVKKNQAVVIGRRPSSARDRWRA